MYSIKSLLKFWLDLIIWKILLNYDFYYETYIVQFIIYYLIKIDEIKRMNYTENLSKFNQ